MANRRRVVIVGGGLAGMAAAIRLAEEGVCVDLLSLVPVKRSHSVCAQGGINACNSIARQQGYSEWMHFDETVLGGDFLADQPPVLEMCNWGPRIIDLLDRMGVPFNRTPEGQKALRLFGGSLFKRTFYAGATTGQQILYGLDEQVRRWEAEGLITKYEFWEFLWPVIHDGQCVGVVAQDLRSMRMRAFPADAVAIASGGNGQIFGSNSTTSIICTGAAVSRCYQAGARYGNPEFIQVHPTAIPGEDKCRLISESARGEGGRLWVPRKPHDTRHPNDIPESERYYFLEERYPKYGNLVPRDIASREVFQVCQEGLGVGGGNMVYLDLTDVVKRVGREAVLAKLEGILEIYEKFVGGDPLAEPMRIFPAVHYTMGGLWVGFVKDGRTGGLKAGEPGNMMTNIPGLYALGECSFAYHGANRLGANSLLSCIFDGLFSGNCIRNYVAEAARIPAESVSASVFERAVVLQEERQKALTDDGGTENPYELWQEMGRVMTDTCTVVRHNDKLRKALEQCRQWKERYRRVRPADRHMWANQNLAFTRALGDMITMSQAMLVGALMRDESRGAHYKPEFPQRNDERYLKATIAEYDSAADCARISYVPVDTSLMPPRARTYGRQ